ncbi:hypothetical protein L7F22_012434 [Adiantum nelumboides]|nr:hypothetical protein [Adiantum nelumboides]
MEDDDVSRQVRQMVAFIKQEANEKAHEISTSSEEEFNILKKEVFEVEQQKIKQEYDRKETQMDTRKKIEYSMQLNNSRLTVLQAQEDLVQEIKKAAQVQMYNLSAEHTTYKHLIRDLIVQGLIKMKEPHLVLRCRHADLKLVKSVLQVAKDRFAAKMKDHPPDVIIDEEIFLPDAEELSTSGQTCAGGVILTSRDGRVICDNTLDSRLEVTFKQILPEIRRWIFGK